MTVSKIEWTEQTWNPIVGCSVTSPGCTNCYAMKMAHRLAGNPATPHYHSTTQMTRGGPVFTGKVALAPEKTLTAPLYRRKPTTYFVNSMGDLFHENVPDEWIDQVFAVMALCPRHRFQILTKRADRMRYHMQKLTDDGPADRLSDSAARHFGEQADVWVANYINGWSRPTEAPDDNPADGTIQRWPLPNVWLGVSAEDQARWNERWPHLARTPAAIRFISAEPLLGPVDMIGAGKLDWVIVGGESGPGARPMHPDWARSLRDQCEGAGTAFFFKQWGEWLPSDQACPSQFDGSPVDAINQWDWSDADERGALHHWDDATTSIHLRKGQSGRYLDGREWNGVPKHEG